MDVHWENGPTLGEDRVKEDRDERVGWRDINDEIERRTEKVKQKLYIQLVQNS